MATGRLMTLMVALAPAHVADRFPGPRPRARLRDPLAVASRRATRRTTRSAQPSREGGAAHSESAEVERLRGEFVRGTDHDLRSPLTIVLGYTEVLLSGEAGPLCAAQAEMLSKVESSSLRLLEAIEDLAGDQVTPGAAAARTLPSPRAALDRDA